MISPTRVFEVCRTEDRRWLRRVVCRMNRGLEHERGDLAKTIRAT